MFYLLINDWLLNFMDISQLRIWSSIILYWPFSLFKPNIFYIQCTNTFLFLTIERSPQCRQVTHIPSSCFVLSSCSHQEEHFLQFHEYYFQYTNLYHLFWILLWSITFWRCKKECSQKKEIKMAKKYFKKFNICSCKRNCKLKLLWD